MIRPGPEQVVRGAALLALVALACMVWSLLDPRPVPIMVSMSVGQALGTLSFLLYAAVVVFEAYRSSRAARPSAGGGDAAPADEGAGASDPGPAA